MTIQYPFPTSRQGRDGEHPHPSWTARYMPINKRTSLSAATPCHAATWSCRAQSLPGPNFRGARRGRSRWRGRSQVALACHRALSSTTQSRVLMTVRREQRGMAGQVCEAHMSGCCIGCCCVRVSDAFSQLEVRHAVQRVGKGPRAGGWQRTSGLMPFAIISGAAVRHRNYA